MNTQLFDVFSEKQLEAIKTIIKYPWGDTDMEFGDNDTSNYAYGFYTNIGRGKEFSGICSGLSKRIKEVNSKAIKMIPNWWGDNKGDMMFFNLDLLECSEEELYKWATK